MRSSRVIVIPSYVVIGYQRSFNTFAIQDEKDGKSDHSNTEAQYNKMLCWPPTWATCVGTFGLAFWSLGEAIVEGAIGGVGAAGVHALCEIGVEVSYVWEAEISGDAFIDRALLI